MRSLVSALVGLTLFVAPAGAGTNESATCFAEGVDSVEAALQAGNWKQAQRLAERLDRRIIGKSAHAGRDCVRAALARVAALRAVAMVGLGDLEAALWLWYGAGSLDATQLPDLDLYPVAAPLRVERQAMPLKASLGRRLVGEKMKGGVKIPRLLRTVTGTRLAGSATVTADLTKEGLPTAVRVRSASAAIGYAVLDLCITMPKRPSIPRFSCKQSY